MSLFGKFAFLQEKSERRRGRVSKNTNLIYNPYKNKLQRIENDKHRVNHNSLQAILGETLSTSEKDHFGHSILAQPEKHQTRFLTYNPNGLPYTDDVFLTQLIRRCLELNVHYCGFSEININTNNVELKMKMQTAVEKFLQNGLFHMNNSKIHGGAVDYQPGGVGAWFMGKLSRKFIGVEYDRRGRWVSHHFRGGERNLKVYTLYRVNNNTIKPGSGSAWEQQRLLLERDKIFTNPRKQVIAEFNATIQRDLENGISILVLGDLNEGIADKEGTNKQFADMGLFNILERTYKHLPKTHREGSKAIDHIWGTADVLSCVDACGYTPFHLISYSDHRGVFVDIDLKRLLPDSSISIPRAPCRILKSTNPRQVKQYNKSLQNKWDIANIDSKWKSIKANILHSGDTPENVRSINKLDKLISDFMLVSEDKSTKISSPMNSEWSEKLHHAAQLVNEWSYKVREALRLNKKGEIQKNTVESCRADCTLARQDLRDIREHAKQHRKEFQVEQASALNTQMQLLGMKGGNYISMIQNTESQSNQFERIQRVLSAKFSKATKCIWIPDIVAYPPEKQATINIYDIDTIWDRVNIDDGRDIQNWKPIENKFMVEQMLLQWQRKHFRQASETPLTTPQWLKWLSDPIIQQQILDGTFEGEADIPYETSLFLNYMIRSVPEKIHHGTTFEEFTNYIRKARESTACSPSGRHYGHYKSLLIGNISILHTIFDIFHTALEAGIILDRWSQTVTTLIEKKKGLPYIHKFRTIHIVEAELQFFTKVIFAKRMMINAEQHGQITDDQYGGRRRRQATSVVLNKTLYYAISKQTVMTAAYMDDDAKACYDRVVPQISEIESQKWGLTYKAANLATKIIHSQQFYVRTGYGVSTASYSYNDKSPIFGVGQGLGWSGPMWLNTSDTINKVLNRKNGGMKFSSFNKEITVEKTNDMFVDDTASGVTENCVVGNRTVVEQLETDEQLHASLLFSAGHRLASQKCLWYVVKYKRKGCDLTHTPTAEIKETLHIKEGFGQKRKIVKNLEADVAHKTLGHWIAPTGNCDKQSEAIQVTADTWAKQIDTSKLSHSDKQLAYTAFLVPAIKYKLVSTNLSFAECDQLMKRVKETLLHAHGMNKNCSRNILFQPHENLGLGYMHWFHMKGFEKLKLFLLHTRRKDTTKKLLDISLSYTQMEAGSHSPILSTDHNVWGKYTTTTWLTDLWHFMGECKVTLEINNSWTYTPPRKHDRFLIELIEDSTLDDKTKKILNQVRIFLKILTLSDMVIINKKSSILPQVLAAQASRVSSYNWPQSPALEMNWKTIWHSFLRSHVQPYLEQHPLGDWVAPTHQEWSTFTNPDMTHVAVDGTTYISQHSQLQESAKPQLCLFPADIFEQRILGYRSFIPQHKFAPKATVQHHDSMWVEKNRGTVITPEKLAVLKKCICTGKCIGVSDGSLRYGYPAHSWCFANSETGEIVLRGSASIDGDVHHISSFRAEAFGLLAMTELAQQVFNDPKMKPHQLTLYSDGDSVIRKIQQPIESRSKYMLQNDIGVALELKSRISSIPNNVRVRYVPGHQDNHWSFEELPFPQQMNVIVDDQVRAFIETEKHKKRCTQFPDLLHSSAWVTHEGGMLSHDIEQTMLRNYYNKEWMAYSKKKFHFTPFINDMIDHKNLGKVLQTSKAGKSQIVKILHANHFTSVMRKRWGLSKEAFCPLCHEKEDSPSHYYYCDHKLMHERKQKLVKDLRKFLVRNETPDALIQVILTLFDMDTCSTSAAFPSYDSYPTTLQLAICEQIDIGVNLFKLGIISSQFGVFHERQSIQTSSKSKCWSRKLIRQLFSISKELWSFRCTVMHEENQETLDKMYRDELWNLHQDLKLEWWKFGPKDRDLLNMEQSFFIKGSNRVIDMWRQQIAVAQSSSFYLSVSNVKDIRTFFEVRKRLPVQKKLSENVTSLVPTQVLYRQMKLSGSPVRESYVESIGLSQRTSIRGKRSCTPTGSITKWLNRENTRQRLLSSGGLGNSQPKNKNKKNSMCVKFLNVKNKVGESSRHAVSPVVVTRKIRSQI